MLFSAVWLIANTTPYAAERTWVQDRDANKIWLVALKATFDIRGDGTCQLADEQVPVLRIGEPIEQAGTVSLAYDADLLGVKVCTDVLVRGKAWAPNDRPASAVNIELRLASVNKRLRVTGDRIWEKAAGGARMSAPVPFHSIPITYERAYGGWDKSAATPPEHRLESRNPVGTGFAVSRDSCVGHNVANIEYPDQLIGGWQDRPAPAGLNAIDRHWSPRRELAGTYDERWRRTRFPLWAEDFDPRYNNSAPADQQVSGFLIGGEGVELVNMSPQGTLRFVLPRIYPCFKTRFGRDDIEHRGQLCSVVIEPEVPRVILTWQTSLLCNDRVDELDATVITEKRVIRP
jgi:hypothetical protein